MPLRPTLALAATAALLAGPALAQDGDDGVSLSFNVGVASDYVFRGASQTNGDGQVFAGADISKGLFYAGTWVSNVDFADSTDAEYDFYVGVTPQWGPVSFDLSALFYGYIDAPKGADYNYFEFQGKASLPLGPVTLGAIASYVPNGYQGIKNAYYGEVNAAYAVNDKVSLSGGFGRLVFNGATDYSNWNLGAGYQVTEKLGLDLRYHDTDKHSLGKPNKSRVVLSAKVTF